MDNIIYQDNEKNRIVFHFNKQSNLDVNLPMWVLKHKGQTFYVNHIESRIGFKTKETPDNPHTKGSIQFVGSLIIIKNGTVIEALIS